MTLFSLCRRVCLSEQNRSTGPWDAFWWHTKCSWALEGAGGIKPLSGREGPASQSCHGSGPRRPGQASRRTPPLGAPLDVPSEAHVIAVLGERRVNGEVSQCRGRTVNQEWSRFVIRGVNIWPREIKYNQKKWQGFVQNSFVSLVLCVRSLYLFTYFRIQTGSTLDKFRDLC